MWCGWWICRTPPRSRAWPASCGATLRASARAPTKGASRPSGPTRGPSTSCASRRVGPGRARSCGTLQWSSAREAALRISWVVLKHRKSATTFPLHQIIDEGAMEFVSEDHPWVQAELAAMPEIRTLYLFLFDNLDGPESRRLYGPEPFTRIQSLATA